VIERWIGCGRVAVSELKIAVEERSLAGRGRGFGIENILDARRRAPPGDTLLEAMVKAKRWRWSSRGLNFKKGLAWEYQRKLLQLPLKP
jgi:hypothetical protein